MYSKLDPAFMRQWDIEYEIPDMQYPDYDNFVKKAKSDSWKCIFTFDFEKQELDDFKHQCHEMHIDNRHICNYLSFISWCDTTEYNVSFDQNSICIAGFRVKHILDTQ